MRSITRRGMWALGVPGVALAVAVVRAEQPMVVWSVDAHNGAINAVACTPDGLIIATAGDDHLVKLWDARTGAALGTVATHYDEVNCLAISGDGAYLASGGQDREIHVIRLSDRQELYTTGHGGFVEGVAFTRDVSALAAGLGYSSNEQVQFRVSDGEMIAIVRHHWGTVWSVAYSNDGSYEATSGADGRVLVYGTPSSLLLELGGHQDDVVAVRFSPDSTLLASAGLFDRRLLLHRVPDGTLAAAIDVGTATLHAVSFSPDGQVVAAAGEEWPVRGRIDLYRVSDGAVLHRYTEGTGLNVGGLAYSPDGRAIAFGRQDGKLVLASNPMTGCYANCDQSSAPPVLNVNDFTCFLARFAAGEEYANCDGSTSPPVLNVNDFVCFQSRFASGCP